MYTCTLCGKETMVGENIEIDDDIAVNICRDCVNKMQEVFNEMDAAMDESNEIESEDAFLMHVCEQLGISPDEIDIINLDEVDNDDDENEPLETNNEESFVLPTPYEIKAELDKHVIGQEDAKRVLAVGIYNHYKRILNNRDDIQKSNIMMIGSTGVGKTELARTVAKILDVPFCIADATTVTEAGYVGDDVENILLKLLQTCDFDIELAERGIIYLDEVDKIARKSENVSITRDVGGEGVQQTLLKIIEGSVVDVPVRGGRKHPQAATIQIDTSNILFICGGAFEGLTMKKQDNKGALGFNATTESEEKTKFEAKDLIKQGMIPELVGRLPIIVGLKDLTKEDLKRILIEPENAIVKQYQNLVGLDNVTLEFSDKALEFIANKAFQNKTGARGLKSIIEDSMNDLMFDLPSEPDVTSVMVDVSDEKLIFKKTKAA